MGNLATLAPVLAEEHSSDEARMINTGETSAGEFYIHVHTILIGFEKLIIDC